MPLLEPLGCHVGVLPSHPALRLHPRCGLRTGPCVVSPELVSTGLGLRFWLWLLKKKTKTLHPHPRTVSLRALNGIRVERAAPFRVIHAGGA